MVFRYVNLSLFVCENYQYQLFQVKGLILAQNER